MSRGSSASFAEFEESAIQRLGSDEAFKARFGELSRSGSRARMIAASLDALKPILDSLSIGECFRGKDGPRAAELLKQDWDEPDDALLLTQALNLAPPRTQLYFDALAERARAWYLAGDPKRCLQDCRLFASTIDEIEEPGTKAENARIDVLLLQADCCKAFGEVIETRSLLNEAMRRIGEMAKERCAKGDLDERYKFEKAELLDKFLQRKPRKTDMPPDARFNMIHQEKLTTPTVDGKVNEILSSCSDAVALGEDKIKGRKLYATRKIKAGRVLIVDRPFSFCTDLAALTNNCLGCHASLRPDSVIKVPCECCQTVQYCSRDCQQRAWDKFHKYECRIFDHFFDSNVVGTNTLLAYRTVAIAADFDFGDNVLQINREFLQFHNSDKSTFDVTALKKYESQDYKTVYGLETHCSDADPSENFERVVRAIFFARCLIYSLNYLLPVADDYEKYLQVLAVALLHSMQAVNCNAYEIVENVRDDETKVLEPRNVGGAIYTSVSLTNHSCYPNVVRHTYPCGTVVVRSLRFIAQGEEILDCYGQHFLENERDTRRKLLEKKYYFKCQCVACTFDWPVTLPNDQFDFKCKKCSQACHKNRVTAECPDCGQKTEISKLYGLLQTSIKKRLTALSRMYDGNYIDALPLLLEHAHCIDKILSEPSLEAIKTQQSIIQCLNAMSSTSI